MSGISGHLVRRGAQMAQVHITKVIAGPSHPHDSQPAMEIDPMKYFPTVAVAIVTVLLIASVCSEMGGRDNMSVLTDKPHRSVTQLERSSHLWP